MNVFVSVLAFVETKGKLVHKQRSLHGAAAAKKQRVVKSFVFEPTEV